MKHLNKRLYLIIIATGIHFSIFGQEFYEKKNQHLDNFIAEKMTTFNIPGASVVILKDKKIIYSKGYGFANLELQSPAKAESNYLIGSITKTFAATAVMMLWEEGRLKLEDKIGSYIPTLPEHWKPITIRQLLNHTSGIVTNQESATSKCQFAFDCDNYTQENLIQETSCLPLNFQPGTKFEYSGRNYYILGMLIEKLSGKPFGQFLNERIFIPLGMTETAMIDYKKIVPNRATGYILENEILSNSEQMDAVVELSDGGLMSSSPDLAKWISSFYTEKLLKRTTIEMMWDNARLTNGIIVTQYGIGFGLTPYKGHKRIGHMGGIPGFSSCLTHFLEQDLTVILLTNVTNSKFSIGQIGNEMAEIYLR
jgi:D-alanyl-D-alanine carboxypeptidase